MKRLSFKTSGNYSLGSSSHQRGTVRETERHPSTEDTPSGAIGPHQLHQPPGPHRHDRLSPPALTTNTVQQAPPLKSSGLLKLWPPSRHARATRLLSSRCIPSIGIFEYGDRIGLEMTQALGAKTRALPFGGASGFRLQASRSTAMEVSRAVKLTARKDKRPPFYQYGVQLQHSSFPFD